MFRRTIGFFALGALLLVLAPGAAIAQCASIEAGDGCCCPEMKGQGHCDPPPTRVESASSCCELSAPPALPASGALEQGQIKKTGQDSADGNGTVTTRTSLEPAKGMAEAHDLSPPAVPLYKLHSALLI